MRPHSIIRTLAATALIALPSLAMAAPDQNTTNNNGCPTGTWRNGQGQCVNNNGNNGQWNNGNGQWNNRDRDRDRERERERREREERNRAWQNSHNGAYNNGGYGNRSGQLDGTVRSFSPYNLYLSNGTHVVLHNGTVINPTGNNLASGERVRVLGTWNQDGTFNANEIDVTSNGYNRYQR